MVPIYNKTVWLQETAYYILSYKRTSCVEVLLTESKTACNLQKQLVFNSLFAMHSNTYRPIKNLNIWTNYVVTTIHFWIFAPANNDKV